MYPVTQCGSLILLIVLATMEVYGTKEKALSGFGYRHNLSVHCIHWLDFLLDIWWQEKYRMSPELSFKHGSKRCKFKQAKYLKYQPCFSRKGMHLTYLLDLNTHILPFGEKHWINITEFVYKTIPQSAFKCLAKAHLSWGLLWKGVLGPEGIKMATCPSV